jgi:hypothetical protein
MKSARLLSLRGGTILHQPANPTAGADEEQFYRAANSIGEI